METRIRQCAKLKDILVITETILNLVSFNDINYCHRLDIRLIKRRRSNGWNLNLFESRQSALAIAQAYAQAYVQA